ncbi:MULTISPECIES: ComF family protein [unclassified Moraxella]|uniref:ComF family protein n=1 Tax=unclassified Moraxella TaxID=2685852 RepID=UPI003AF87776
MAIKLDGSWSVGYAYDKHIEHSTFLGYDDQGRPLFDTTRTYYMGELIYQLKYQQKLDNIDKIIDLLLAQFSNFEKFNMVVPAPFSTPRLHQPVYLIAEQLAKRLNISYQPILHKIQAKIPLKNLATFDEKIENLSHNIELDKQSNVANQTILLLDDLFDSGATLDSATQLLMQAGAKEVNVLVLTKTRG